AGDLDHVGAPRDVDDLRAEDVDDVDELAARALVGGDLDEHELALDVLGLGEVRHLDDVDELVQLLLDLLEDLVVAARHEGDARYRRVHRLGHRQALDVEAPPAEEARDAREHAELVLDQDGDGVPHGATSRSVLAVAGQDLHDLVLTGELQLLEAFLLDLLVGRQVVLLLERTQLALEVDVFVVVPPEIRLALKQGPDQLLVLFLHRFPPASSERKNLSAR